MFVIGDGITGLLHGIELVQKDEASSQSKGNVRPKFWIQSGIPGSPSQCEVVIDM